MTENELTDHVVTLREGAEGWRQVDGPRLTSDDPFLTGLEEQEAEALVRSNWALQHATVDEAREFHEGTAAAEPPFDPSELTVDELEAELADGEFTDHDLDVLATAEQDGKERDTALDAIEAARSGDPEGESDDEEA